jgi:hypothetical protein
MRQSAPQSGRLSHNTTAIETDGQPPVRHGHETVGVIEAIRPHATER